MEAFVQQQNRSSSLGKRFDYVALAPAAAALCYPFLLRAFHAIVGSQAATPSLPCDRRRDPRPGRRVRRAVSRARARLPSHRHCRGEALGLCQRGRADALCLPWRRPGPGSQSHLRRNRLVRDLARDRDLVAVRPKSRRCPSARGRALAGRPWADGGDPLPLRVVPSHQSSVRPGRPRCPRNRHEDRTRGLSLRHRSNRCWWRPCSSRSAPASISHGAGAPPHRASTGHIRSPRAPISRCSSSGT